MMTELEAIRIVKCLAECSSLHQDFERSRKIGEYEVDELAPRSEQPFSVPSAP